MNLVNKVLVLSPHTDDSELGAGGYLAKLAEEGAEITSVTFSTEFHGLDLEEEWMEAVSVAACDWRSFGFRVRQFDKSRQAILETMVRLRDEYAPDLVFIPSKSDVHQDHSVIYAEALRAFSKQCCVLSYELPWNTRKFEPNYFTELSGAHLDLKNWMLKKYKSQLKLNRPYFDPKFTEALARTRGQQIRKEYAEAFEVVNWIA
jgi:LmbE family N-acetylglucosaminyl deacetylase